MTMMNKYILLVISALAIWSCGSDAVKAPDVSQVEVDFDIIRLDQKVAAIDTNYVARGVDQLMHDYPSAAALYLGTLNPFTKSDNVDTISVGLREYLTNPFTQNLQDTINILYGDLTDIKEDYTQAYKYLKHYFPEADIANIYMMNTVFNYQRFLFNDDDDSNALGVGLDLFLDDYPYKRINPQNESFSEYLTRSFDKEHLVKKTMELNIDDLLGDANGTRMIDQMIHNGKRLYMLDHILPETHDSIIMEYTTDQWNWVKDNELDMWSFFFDQELFYETNLMTINKYLTYRHTSPGMPSIAPGRTANYIGWKIVEAYMKRYPETTMQDLIGLIDAQKFLEKSKYKPRAK